MDVWLLGNGFDLHHKFPTSYLNFLHTIKFLIEHYDSSLTTVGSIFGNKTLQAEDKFIQECYEKHSGVYNITNLPHGNMQNMIDKIKDNDWFSYLCNSVTDDIKWIDFEKEIIRVLDAFDALFSIENDLSLDKDDFSFNWFVLPIDLEDKFLLKQFDFFYYKLENEQESSDRRFIKKEYLVEKTKGSGVYYLSKDEIASALFKSLRDLADVLRDYLLYFVDYPTKELNSLGLLPHFRSVSSHPSRVYSFNYTNTVEILYNNAIVDHIHGNTNTDIVLGINPDKNDEIGSVDTTFLQFKKYFQRVFFNSDMEFLRDMKHTKTLPQTYDRTLYVIGHSLDSTDEDIIKKVFESAKTIIVLYHSKVSVKDQINNLVKIFGKEGLDYLRKEKSLVFLPQSEIDWIATDND